MSPSLFIARRYLFARRGVNIITLLSTVAVMGIAITTMALVITLSVFNGFKGMVHQLFSRIDPQYRVELTQGKQVDDSDPVVKAVIASPDVAAYSLVLEDNALLTREGRQVVVTLKGVDNNYQQVTLIDSVLYGSGEYTVEADVLHYGILGAGVASQLGFGAAFDGPLDVYAPRPGERINMANPAASFRHDQLYSPSVVLGVQQAKYDNNYCITSLNFARDIFSAPEAISAIELKLRQGANRKQVEKLLDHRFKLLDSYQQQADILKIMNVEKAVSFAFMTLILLIVGFNIISSLSMLIIDKRDDIATLRAIGGTDGFIRRVFFLEGMLIAVTGAVIGIILGVIACLLQQHYGLVHLGDSGSFIIDAYPVEIVGTDLVLTFATVLIVSAVAIAMPIQKIKPAIRS